MNLPSSVRIREVGPRDGLQAERAVLDTTTKVRFVDLLSAAGLPQINVVSFVHPRAVPQMADAERVLAGIARRPGIRYDASVPNLIGARRAVAAGADELSVFVAASETSNRKNVGLAITASLAAVPAIVATAAAAAVPVIGCISTAFGCPYEGAVPEAQVCALADAFVAAGCRSLMLADTTGVGNPKQVARMVATMRARHPDHPLWLHLHDTRGAGLANVLAALDAGATHFDAAVAGLGGCPFIAGASGNIVTEDLVHLLHDLGIATGIDLDALLDAARFIAGAVGHPVDSRLLRAGKRTDLIPA